jgi:hypothetical protein
MKNTGTELMLTKNFKCVIMGDNSKLIRFYEKRGFIFKQWEIIATLNENDIELITREF